MEVVDVGVPAVFVLDDVVGVFSCVLLLVSLASFFVAVAAPVGCSQLPGMLYARSENGIEAGEDGLLTSL